MIERKFVANNMKEFQIKEFIKANVGRVGLSNVRLQKTPLGEKIIISASRPGLVVGRAGSNISKMTKDLKREFKLENPQIEIEEVTETGSDADIIAELIAGSLERFGSARFKGIGHKAMSNVIDSGALGVEIIISGKIPGSRAKDWRFYKGYLKKCGDISVEGVLKAYAVAKLKTGIVGIKVSIMPSTIKLPDKISLIEQPEEKIEEISGNEEKKVKEVEKLDKQKTETKISEESVKVVQPKEKEEKLEQTPEVEKKVVELKSVDEKVKKTVAKKAVSKKTVTKKIAKATKAKPKAKSET
ncbi:MAG: 30S ribosomal protein S3, partial [archaeon]